MKGWLAHQACKRPDAPALIAGAECLSWQALAEHAGKRAAVLVDRGLGRGHVVAVEAETSLESVCWMHAVFWMGATLFPLPPRLPAAVLKQRLSRLAPDALVVSDPGQVVASAISGETVILKLTAPMASTDDGPPPGDIDYQDMLTIVWTSGSSGAARAVPLTVANHLASTRAIAERLGITANDRWLLCLPLEHIGGLAILVRAMITGASVVLHDHFNPDRVRADLTFQPITLASMVPTMLARLVEHSSQAFQSNLRALLIGGAPATPKLLHDARGTGLPVVPTWGMTETCSQLATLDPAEAARTDFLDSPGLVGRPLPGVEVRVERDPTCPDGEENVGRLLVRGPMVFSGYSISDSPAQLRIGDWFDTGDVGRIDAQGRVIMAHRASDLIISGGVNINAREVENVLLRSPWVEDAAVLGLPHPSWGEQVVAVVALGNHDHHLDDIPATLTRWCRQYLAPAQIPRRWRVLVGLPRNAAGKCLRDELTALFADQSKSPVALPASQH